MNWSWANIDWDKTLSALVAIATIAQAVVGIVMMRGLKHARVQAENAIVQATAANAALRAAEVATERQLRAYVQVLEVTVEPRVPNEPWCVTCKIKNFGQTPALKVRHAGRVDLFSRQTLTDAQLIEPIGDESGPVGPGDIYEITSYIPAAAWMSINADLLSGDEILAALGRVIYEDIFEISHETNYKCYLSNAKGDCDLMAHWSNGNDMN